MGAQLVLMIACARCHKRECVSQTCLRERLVCGGSHFKGGEVSSAEVATFSRNGISYERNKMVVMYRSVGRRRSFLRHLASGSFNTMRRMERRLGMVHVLRTLAAFAVGLLLSPVFLVICVVARQCRKLWHRAIKYKFPDVEIVGNSTIRTAMDTRVNPGIITLVLDVKGTCSREFVKERLTDEILEKRTAEGKLAYPNFRKVLEKRWGVWVWVKSTDFNLDKHVTLASHTYGGRAVNEQNIQDYVNSILKHPLPQNMPAWQATLVPVAGLGERFYLLLRLHHLVGEGLALRELLSQTLPDPWSPNSLHENNTKQPTIRCPKALFKLYSILQKSLIRWVEERIHILESVQERMATIDGCHNAGEWIVLGAITIFLAAKESGHFASSRECLLPTRLCLAPLVMAVVVFPAMLQKQSKKSNLQVRAFWKLLKISLTRASNTVNFDILWNLLQRFLWYLICLTWHMIVLCFHLPFVLWRESRIFRSRLDPWYELLRSSAGELMEITRAILECPRLLLQELVEPYSPHHLGKFRSRGHHVVAWSEPVSLELIRCVRSATGATVGEITLAACARALREYYRQLGLAMPDSVLATIPVHAKQFTELTGDAASGLITVALPTDVENPAQSLQEVRNQLSATRRQPTKYLISVWLMRHASRFLPSTLVRVTMEYLTRKYPVTVTNISIKECHMDLWGLPVDTILMWRPPQGNIALSLSVVTYGDTVRLGVMADLRLAPYHSNVTTNFKRHLLELAAVAGVPRERLGSRSNRPSPMTTPKVTPPASPGPQRLSFKFP